MILVYHSRQDMEMWRQQASKQLCASRWHEAEYTWYCQNLSFSIQAIPVPQAKSLDFTNDRDGRLHDFPFVIEESVNLQKLTWSGQGIHVRQLKALKKSHLHRLEELSLTLETSSCDPTLDLHKTQREVRVLACLQNLRRLSINNFTLAGPGLLEAFLPLKRWAHQAISSYIKSNRLVLTL